MEFYILISYFEEKNIYVHTLYYTYWLYFRLIGILQLYRNSIYTISSIYIHLHSLNNTLLLQISTYSTYLIILLLLSYSIYIPIPYYYTIIFIFVYHNIL
uniref:hypothetical protein n=1 Tax=Malassezia brasiliensis TaxID=1821822 RepID=UPI0030031E1C|nr:hypothetical protein [Malassezia brasiliensis]WBU10724.1 hypothetical protein [Malassezia brasiliensis]